MQITLCGGGNAAHTLAGLISARQDFAVRVYAPLGDEAQRWRRGIQAQGGIVVLRQGERVVGRPDLVSDDPADVVPGSQLVLLALPAFAHETMLLGIRPYLDDGAWVGALPARAGFEWGAWEVLGDRASSVALFGLQTLPWACRVQHFGREVTILGAKAEVDLAAWPTVATGEIAALLTDLLEVHIGPVSNFLSLTLAGTGQIIHPGVMYGLFHDWDGQTYTEAPLFYQGVTLQTAQVLQQLSDEIQALRARLEEAYPELDLSAVRPLHEWLCRSYAKDIVDTSSLQSCFVTNRGYAGLRAPMRASDSGLVPDFQSRYLAEDLPYGLVVTRGIAQLAGVPTPVMDRVITWAQGRLGETYLVEGRLAGHSVASTRAPQRYGFTSLDEIMDDT